MHRLLPILLIVLASVLPEPTDSAMITVYGLESAVFDRIFDPDARPEELRLVSGSLKLVGQMKGTWEAVAYIPQTAAAPRSDRGIFTRFGNRIVFYSWLTFSRYAGEILEDGERIQIAKLNRFGQSQTETWYLGR